MLYNFFKNFDEISFHMPGHKGRIPFEIKDITEIEGSDNLMSPSGIIKLSEEKMAEALSKRSAFFLTNGASSGIVASILNETTENEEILVDRNCHISVINGLILSGAIPKFIYPTINQEFCIPNPISKNDFKYNGEKTIIITSPTYYGDISDNIKENATLICDEAHGAHFYFSDKLKKSVQKNADITILGFHKTMPTLNQGAVLAVNSDKVDVKRLKSYINMLTTTSPSYPIMQSLNYSQIVGRKIYNNLEFEQLVANFKKDILLYTPLKILENTDSYKILINFDNVNLYAKEVNSILIKKYRIYAEGVFANNILFMLSPYNTFEEIEILKKAIISLNLTETNRLRTKKIELIKLELAVTPKEAFHQKGEMLQIKDTVGKISKENIVEFPPCVPIVTIGERITKDILPYINKTHIEVIL